MTSRLVRSSGSNAPWLAALYLPLMLLLVLGYLAFLAVLFNRFEL